MRPEKKRKTRTALSGPWQELAARYTLGPGPRAYRFRPLFDNRSQSLMAIQTREDGIDISNTHLHRPLCKRSMLTQDRTRPPSGLACSLCCDNAPRPAPRACAPRSAGTSASGCSTRVKVPLTAKIASWKSFRSPVRSWALSLTSSWNSSRFWNRSRTLESATSSSLWHPPVSTKHPRHRIDWCRGWTYKLESEIVSPASAMAMRVASAPYFDITLWRSESDFSPPRRSLQDSILVEGHKVACRFGHFLSVDDEMPVDSNARRPVFPLEHGQVDVDN